MWSSYIDHFARISAGMSCVEFCITDFIDRDASNGKGYCKKGVRDISKLLGFSIGSVSRSIRKVEESGYVFTEQIGREIRRKTTSKWNSIKAKNKCSIVEHERSDVELQRSIMEQKCSIVEHDTLYKETLSKVYTLQTTSEGDNGPISKTKTLKANRKLDVKNAPTPGSKLKHVNRGTQEWETQRQNDPYNDFSNGHPWFGFGRFWIQFLALKTAPAGSWVDALKSFSKIPSTVEARSKVYDDSAKYLSSCKTKDSYSKHASTWLNAYVNAGFREAHDLAYPEQQQKKHVLSAGFQKKKHNA